MVSSMKKDLNAIYKKILSELWEYEESIPFREPVDHKSLGLVDYPLIIKTPMDLSTIKKKLKANKYRKNQDFLEDLQLIWDNCQRYNQENSQIFRAALKMEKVSRRILKKYSILKKTAGNTYNSRAFSKKISKNTQKTQTFEKLCEEDRAKLTQLLRNCEQKSLFRVFEAIRENMAFLVQETAADRFVVPLNELNKETIEKIYGIFQENQEKNPGNPDIN